MCAEILWEDVLEMDDVGDLEEDVRITLSWFLWKCVSRMGGRCNWLRIMTTRAL
jgi:hypothetical protein